MANSVQIATLFKTEEIFLRTLIFYVLSTLITFRGFYSLWAMDCPEINGIVDRHFHFRVLQQMNCEDI